MSEDQGKNNSNGGCHVDILGLVADESNFGPLLDKESSYCFKDDFIGRKSFALSERPSVEWIKQFNKKHTNKHFLLQPHKKRIYVLTSNDRVWVIHEWLSRDIEDINNYLKKENVEEMYVTEVSNAKYIKNYLNGRGFKKLNILNKDGMNAS
ncbi:hypothetical protein [Phytobacter diazotrophicus]|uniref:hypothetical protein n=1 Tax=Phytobacter diazotrophicus TaxID=395631 RepID=UPI002914943F|nr:hypothetical protein [Enterobacteriaceae bacterium]